MPEHTPGPWRDAITSDGGLVVYLVEPASQDKPYDANFLFFGDLEDTTPEDHADAKLVAAAPDLLAACEEAVKALELWPESEWGWRERKAYDVLSAAIALARA